MTAPAIAFPTRPATDAERARRDDRVAEVDESGVPLPPRYSDVAIARDFATRHFENLRFVPEWGRWNLYDGTLWRTDDGAGVGGLLTAELARVARAAAEDVDLGDKRSARERAARQIASGRTAREVERLAQRDRRLVIAAGNLDQHDHLLNTPAGTIDLRTGELQQHRREDFLTRCTAVPPGSGGARFSRFLLEITCDDGGLVDYLQRALGACCFASSFAADHWLMFWHGVGRNGKNTLGDLVMHVLGSYARAVPSATLLADDRNQQHPTLLANLAGLRLAVSSEIDEGARWSESRIKANTGDTMIAARFMRQDFFEFRRTHRHLIYGNHRPLIANPDPALAARLHLVPFLADFSGDRGDPALPAALREEAPAVLRWLIAGAAHYFEDGATLRKCAIVDEATRSYFADQSTFDTWKEECLRLDPDARTAARELYTSYAKFKEQRGEKPLSQTRWGEEMRRRFRAFNSRGRGYEGVALADPNDLLDGG